ncbi:extracellular solute-binding protein [Streptomyces sporangiiformans]|uniref:Extracellular solute-binding protein n=1 Tax=Streptomyces sporangiiformans TaxID=2315329 RepID=A0A505DMD8_9ACTN|nr:extracellular solute-binding protein [Streptomyces sporangiiformans]TPQ21469.1 extracellular solute-binding protein [Streptomyces sporangiiformans]
MRHHASHGVRVAAGAAVIALTASGCGGGSSDSANGGTVTLTVTTHVDYGYRNLYKEFEKTHPGIKVKEVLVEDLPKKLVTQLAANRGAADVVGVGDDIIGKFKPSHERFLNLADHGVNNTDDPWVQWAYDAGTVEDGKFVMGLRTDIGGLGICYRTDLFKKAGLPTEPEKVAELWPTWDDFTATGEKFSKKVKNASFTANTGDIWVGMGNQHKETFFAESDDSFIADKNTELKQDFLTAANMSVRKVSGGYPPFSPEMANALKTGKAATAVCPAWKLDRTKEASGPDNAGKWSVAAAPEGGNWGGSYLMVPKQTKHPKEAVELARWLTSSKTQKQLFLDEGYLSSHPKVYNDPEVQAKKDPYFSNAPTGKIFAQAADSMEPIYRGTKDSDVASAFMNALLRVEQGKQKPEAAWDQAIEDAKKVAG